MFKATFNFGIEYNPSDMKSFLCYYKLFQVTLKVNEMGGERKFIKRSHSLVILWVLAST